MSLTISTTSHASRRLSAPGQNPVVITHTGTINTTGAVALYGARSTAWHVANDGVLAGGHLGVLLETGGSVANGGGNPNATIRGGFGGVAIAHAAGSVVNDGTIRAGAASGYGVALLKGGSLDNGQAQAGALIGGGGEGVLVLAAAGRITNDGTIRANGPNGAGVLLAVGGSVTNGAANTAATIGGVATGVSLRGSGAIVNDGTILSSGGNGVYRVGSGSVTNGSGAARHALIAGSIDGVRLVASGNGTNLLTNAGRIVGRTGIGAELGPGGTILNGADGNGSALISGATNGVMIHGVGTVTNYGTIVATNPLDHHTPFPPVVFPRPNGWVGPGSYGINLRQSGLVTNGSEQHTAAYVYGSFVGVNMHAAPGTVDNFGTIKAALVGIYTWLGGTVVNGSETDRGALISGGMFGTWNTYPGGTVVNFATITSDAGYGVGMGAGGHPNAAGLVVNGSASDRTALISGAIHGVTTINKAIVENYGTMIGTSGAGCYVSADGALTNGSAADRTALIQGHAEGAALKGAVMTLANDATIVGAMMGVALFTGGTVRNGADNVTSALISAGSSTAVYIHGNRGTLLNAATVRSAGGYGVLMTVGGTVTNGSTNLHGASIIGSEGVDIAGGGTVANYGSIIGRSLSGVELTVGGMVRNAGPSALISGAKDGVFAHGDTARVGNGGSILATAGNGLGIYLQGGGSVTNGSAPNTVAAIAGGRDGVRISHGGSVGNYGTITGSTADGVYLMLGGTVTNGSAQDRSALIQGGLLGVLLRNQNGTVINHARILSAGRAVYAQAGGLVMNDGTIAGAMGVNFGVGAYDGTLVNAGTIQGTGGSAVQFGSGNDVLVVDPGAAFVGTVDGGLGNNVIELAAGAGDASMAGLGSQFTEFQAVAVDAGAVWTMHGANSIATLLDQGTLRLDAGASLAVSGALEPSGGGSVQLATGATLEVASLASAGSAIQFLGSAELVVDAAPLAGGAFALGQSPTATLQGLGSGDVIDLRGVALGGASLAYDGASGLLQVNAGGTTLAALNVGGGLGGAAFSLGNDGTGHCLIQRA